MKLDVLEVAKELINFPSITPNDAGCQPFIAKHLSKLGFQIENLKFADVDNLWAKIGTGSPHFVFAGHTDVVPPGLTSDWLFPPFSATVKDELLYGRGIVDMKGGIAAFLAATHTFLNQHKIWKGSISLLITSDEEGSSINGTKKVIEALQQRGETIDYCIVAEPSSHKKVGDRIRIGRRGSLHGHLIVHGKQGHVANPENALNPIHHAFYALDQLAQSKWDEGNEHFPPTTFQITNINAGTGALNVIPSRLEAFFNFRYGTANTVQNLKAKVQSILDQMNINYDIKWDSNAEPFIAKQKNLPIIASEIIENLTGRKPELSTGGGTSDARFIVTTGAETIELGLSNETAHQVNECTTIEDLRLLEIIYQKILQRLLLDPKE